MQRIYQILLPLLSLFLVRVDLTDLFPLVYKVRVIRVLDGDTLLIELAHHEQKLRLSKIDAPELRQPFFNGQKDAGLASKKCLLSLLDLKKMHDLQIEKKDMYGRILGDLSGLTFKLVQHGCSSLYPYAQFSSQTEKRKFLTELFLAQTEKRGLWKEGGYLKPKLWRKFHKSLRRKE